MVKAVKKTFLKALSDTTLNLNKTFTMLAEIKKILNEYPIVMKPREKSGTNYLYPNSLLLGRSSHRIVVRPFQAKQMMTDNPKTTCTR